MKKFITFLLVTGFVFSACAQSATDNKPAPDVLQVKEKGYDFGKIQQNRPVTHIFEVVNTGTEPLRLENVQASCGCTTPEWSRDPIQPGATASIKVGFCICNGCITCKCRGICPGFNNC